MAKGGVWNLKEILKQNPVSAEEALSKSFGESIELGRTYLTHGKGGSLFLLQQIQTQKEPYIHVRELDEIVYVLEGEGEFVIDGVAHKMGPGDIVYVPAGTPHGPYFPSGGVRLVVHASPFNVDNPT